MNIKYNSLKFTLTIVLLAMVLLPTLTIGWMTHDTMAEYLRRDRISDVGRVAATKHEQLIMVLDKANKRAENLLSDLASRCGGNSLCATGLIRAYLTAEGAIGAKLQGGGHRLTIGVSAVGNDEKVVFQAGQLAKFSSTGAHGDHAYFVMAAKGKLVLSVTYPSQTLEPVFNPPPADLGLTGETFLADGAGYFVTHPRYVSAQGLQLPISAHPMQSCLAGQSGEMLALDYRDAKIIHGYRYIPELGQACIMAHIDQEEAFAPLKLLQRQTVIAIALFCALLVIATLYLAGRIVQPVTRLTKVARAIAEGDYQAQAEVKGSNEIAELASTFNFMTGRLHAAQMQFLQDEAEIRRINAELEQRVAERTSQLEAANKELESFNYSVAHDLRSPLRSIDGFSRVLVKHYHDLLDETGKGYLGRVCRASQRMGHLIDDLLQLSQVMRGVMQLESVDLSRIAAAVVEDLRKNHPLRQVEFTVQQGLMVDADPGLLRAVMDNLLGNAWKFSGNNAQAEIEFGECDIEGERIFFVRDNGVGFNMAYVGKLFGAFQRLHTLSEFEGTGIGLATVQRIIQRHNGRVWAKAMEGQGATFYFTLPQVGIQYHN